MTVYLLVLTDGYDSYSVEGIFSTYELAEAAQDPAHATGPDRYEITPYNLDRGNA